MKPTKTRINEAYQLFLSRRPTPQEVARMHEQVESVAQMRDIFLSAPEFQRKYRSMTQRLDRKLPPSLIHLHIPKTAGSSLGQALSSQPALQPNHLVYENGLKDFQAMPRSQRRELRYIRGHVSQAVVKAFDLPHRLMCVIRRPGPRIFSFYQFISRTPTHPAYEMMRARKLSFGEYLEFSLTDMAHQLELDNGQIRRLAGRFAASGLGQEPALLRKAVHVAMAPEMLLGFTEHLDLFTARLVAEGYLPEASVVPRANVSPDPGRYDSAVAGLTPDQRRIFDSFTAWDKLLYETCETLIIDAIQTSKQDQNP